MEILLVEDNKIIQWVMVNNLKTLGFNVDVAGSGSKALRLYDSKRYDLILLDINLPDMSGIEVGKKMREMGKLWPNIVGVTTFPEDVKLECLRAGFNAVYNKPVLLTELTHITNIWAKLKLRRA